MCLGVVILAMVAMHELQMDAWKPQELVKPTSDTLEYRQIRLENGMEVLLVHDEGTDKAAASVDVSLRPFYRFCACLPRIPRHRANCMTAGHRSVTAHQASAACLQYREFCSSMHSRIPRSSSSVSQADHVQQLQVGSLSTRHEACPALLIMYPFASQVRIGSLSDPVELPGLAHFTEHMLFYASEKYPQEDAYSK